MNTYAEVMKVEIFDPVTMMFNAGPNLNVGRVRHSSTVLADGRVVHVGGTSAGKTAEICSLTSCTMVSCAYYYV